MAAIDDDLFILLFLRIGLRERERWQIKHKYKKRFWVRRLFVERKEKGEYHLLIQDMKLFDYVQILFPAVQDATFGSRGITTVGGAIHSQVIHIFSIIIVISIKVGAITTCCFAKFFFRARRHVCFYHGTKNADAYNF